MAVKVVQPYRAVSINGTATVQCFIQPRPSLHQIQPSSDQGRPYPYPNPKELRVTLLKGLHGNQELCSNILNSTMQQQKSVGKQGEVQCSTLVGEGAMEVTVSGLKATDTDFYRCQLEVFFPPPYLRFTGNGTLIHVLDSSDCPVQPQRQIAHQADEEKDEKSEDTVAVDSLPVVILMTLVIVVLIIIIYLQVVQCEQGRRILRPMPGMLHKTDAAAFSC
ncbi:hypothetical protein L3Q82_017272 [Scortum barcoo]|uniref:Uncharacterized protein n=1 Tax=Scortum barcoo TaxID=214431 RepID=A0ACB8VJZ2_9TELE|nr:hypothetical protein L3Q82_017272 [Scortum barcoo]